MTIYLAIVTAVLAIFALIGVAGAGFRPRHKLRRYENKRPTKLTNH